MPGSPNRSQSGQVRTQKPRVRTLVFDDASEASHGSPHVGIGTGSKSPSSHHRSKRVVRASDGDAASAALASSSGHGRQEVHRPRKRHSIAGNTHRAIALQSSGKLAPGSKPVPEASGSHGSTGRHANIRASESDMVVVSKAALEAAFAR